MGFYCNGKKIGGINFIASDEQISNVINNKTMEMLNNGTISTTVLNPNDYEFQEVLKNYPQCKNYKGNFTYPTDANYWNTTAQKGDYWIQNFNNIIHYHRYVFEPGDIMYFNGTTLEPLKVVKKSKTIKPVKEVYDVCIVGGGAGGIGCAYALKDSGLNVILIDREAQLGGTHTSGGLLSMIASPINGTWFKTLLEEERTKGYASFKGSVSGSENNAQTVGEGTEFEQKYRASLYNTSESNIGNLIATSPYQMSKRYYNDLHEKIDIRLNTEFVENLYGTDNTKVQAIKVKDKLNNTIYNINAYYFVDCSADGVLCRSGKTKGTDYFIGSDAKTKYNESAYTDGFAGNENDINTIDLLYKVPADSYSKGEVARTEDFSRIKPFTDITKGYVNSSFYEPTVKSLRILSPGKYLNLPVSIMVKNGYDATLEEAKKRVHYHYTKCSWNSTTTTKGGYSGCFPMLAIRETYRINCDRMLQQSDVETRATSSNYISNHTIALSSWYADIHNSTNIGNITSSWLIGIPYECLIPSAFTNVLVGSRCFGASHIGASAVRVTKTMMSLGYVCGKAMELAVGNWLDDMRNVNITTLQANVGIADLITEMETYFPQS